MKSKVKVDGKWFEPAVFMVVESDENGPRLLKVVRSDEKVSVSNEPEFIVALVVVGVLEGQSKH